MDKFGTATLADNRQRGSSDPRDVCTHSKLVDGLGSDKSTQVDILFLLSDLIVGAVHPGCAVDDSGDTGISPASLLSNEP